MDRKRKLNEDNPHLKQYKLANIAKRRKIIDDIKAMIQQLTLVNPELPEEIIFNILRYTNDVDDVLIAFQELGRQILF